MSHSPVSAATMTDAEKTEHIKRVVLAEGLALRERYPLLRHQNTMGALILAFALAGMVGTAALYIEGLISAWITIPVIAIFASLTHELEHDLIHWMYFRKTPWAHHLMMALVWLARPSTINPWVRRELHFNHHKFSGTARDLEERALSNGEVWNLRRLLMIGDNVIALAFRFIAIKDWATRQHLVKRAFKIYFPLGLLHWASWHIFLAFHAANGLATLMGSPLHWSPAVLEVMQGVDLLTVVWVAPNVLRTFSLHFITSNMHYYGDVEEGNVIQQTQVLNAWWLAPLQLFCFNFGSTHGIHHFVVKEPFYIRQLSAPVAHRVMREMGVRFNDFGTFRRANRWKLATQSGSPAPL